MSKFTHLHVHTHYSILDGAAKVKDLIKKAKDLGMDSIAITDHGNMFGVMEFVNEANNAGIKPIIGVETYIARRGVENKSTREDRSGYHLVLLAKMKSAITTLSIWYLAVIPKVFIIVQEWINHGSKNTLKVLLHLQPA